MSKIGSPRKNLIYDDAGKLVDGLSQDKSTGTYITQFKDDIRKPHLPIDMIYE